MLLFVVLETVFYWLLRENLV